MLSFEIGNLFIKKINTINKIISSIAEIAIRIFILQILIDYFIYK